MKRMTLPKKKTVLLPVLVTLSIGTLSAAAQAPLDMRVINQRLDQIETQIGELQVSGSANYSQIPIAAGDASIQMGSLPTDAASRLQVRIVQLERLVEALTGQFEQTRFEVSQMRAQLQQFYNDVSYRLAVVEQAAGVSSAVALPAVPPPNVASGQLGSVGAGVPMSALPSQSGLTAKNVQPNNSGPALAQAPSDLFEDATVRQQNVTGPLAAERRIEADLNMPMSSPVQPQPQMATRAQEAAGIQLLKEGQIQTAPVNAGPVNQGDTFGVIRTDAEGNILPPSAEAPQQAALLQGTQQLVPAEPQKIEPAPSPGPVASAQIGTVIDPVMAMTELPPGTPQEQYEYAFDILRQAEYGRAEMALRLFLEANSEDTLAGNAQYWLGETFYVRGDFEQAAVEFLSGYQTYPQGNKAPDNLLKLGLSMARLGQTDGACTALSRLSTEYPDANDTIQRRAQTERARLSCS